MNRLTKEEKEMGIEELQELIDKERKQADQLRTINESLEYQLKKVLNWELNNNIEKIKELSSDNRRLSKLVIDRERLMTYAKFYFPAQRKSGNNITDICRMCGTWTSGPFTALDGRWKLQSGNKVPYNTINTHDYEVALCDRCMDQDNSSYVGKGDTITLPGEIFIIDTVKRINS